MVSFTAKLVFLGGKGKRTAIVLIFTALAMVKSQCICICNCISICICNCFLFVFVCVFVFEFVFVFAFRICICIMMQVLSNRQSGLSKAGAVSLSFSFCCHQVIQKVQNIYSYNIIIIIVKEYNILPWFQHIHIYGRAGAMLVLVFDLQATHTRPIYPVQCPLMSCICLKGGHCAGRHSNY